MSEEYSPLILSSNQHFLTLYREYVVAEWRIYYIVYDELKVRLLISVRTGVTRRIKCHECCCLIMNQAV
jgi:Cys-tRNA synthase (O-phospho-L-seryl-tRNA:Cys-tRNA synthase)